MATQSENTDETASFADEVAAGSRPRRNHPQGWEPGVAWNGREGTLTTPPLEADPTTGVWSELVADWGLDPLTTEVVEGSVQVRAWDTHDGRRLRYYRATLRARELDYDRPDVDALCRLVERRRPVKPLKGPERPDRALVVLIADWQLGKAGEPNGGTPETVERICRTLDYLPARIKELKKAGRPVDTVYLVGLGDLVEQCTGHYPGQTFNVDLDRREQMRLARRLILRAVDNVLGLTPRVVLAAVPGNHGENRLNGKSFTRTTDNDDLAVVEQVAEILAANEERYGSCTTVLASGNNLVLNIAGIPVAFAHGHKAGASGHPAAKLENWWKGQVMGRQPIADADILITGHYHHFICSETSGRTFMQAPAMDGGSAWWTDMSGQNSPAGLLTLGIGTGYGPRGWGDLHIHSA